MPTWLKVLLVIVGLIIVLVGILIVGGVYLINKHGPALVETAKQTHGEGAEFGQQTDQKGCLDEGVERHRRTAGLTDQIKNALFLRACLDASRETPGFCDSVPSQIELVKSIKWQISECERYGLSSETQCGQLFKQVQQSCDARRTP